MIIDGPPILTAAGFYDGTAINGFGKKLKKIGKKLGKTVKKAGKQVEKVAKKAAPIALSLTAAYMTGGASAALTSGLGLFGGAGGGTGQDAQTEYLSQIGLASGGGFGGMLANGGNNTAVDWGTLATRGLDYLRTGDANGGYSFGGALESLRNPTTRASNSGRNATRSGGSSSFVDDLTPTASGTSNTLPIVGVVAAAGLLLLLTRR